LPPLFRHPPFSAITQASALGEPVSNQVSSGSASASTTSLAEIERVAILRVYEQARGDKARTWKMLGISRATLYRKLKRYNIPLKGGGEGTAAEPSQPS
jgi:transcriptional regulator of acetoin/glycerol metabolism